MNGTARTRTSSRSTRSAAEACEVKGWHTESTTVGLLKSGHWTTFASCGPAATAAARKLIGTDLTVERLVVLPPPGLRTDPDALARSPRIFQRRR